MRVPPPKPTNGLLSREALEKFNRDIGERVLVQLRDMGYVPPQLLAANIDPTGAKPAVVMHVQVVSDPGKPGRFTAAHIAGFARQLLDPEAGISQITRSTLGGPANVAMHISEAQLMPHAQQRIVDVLMLTIYSDRGVALSMSFINVDDQGRRSAQIEPLDFAPDAMKLPYGEVADLSPDTLATIARARAAAGSTLAGRNARPGV